MDQIFTIFAALLLMASAATGWTLTLLGLPGNWLMVFAAALYAWIGPGSGIPQIGWFAVFSITALAAIGELAELVTSVWGARRAGGSRRAAVFSLIGSMGGAIVGVMLGLPIPLLGPPIAALLGGALGALAGAAAAEQIATRGPRRLLGPCLGNRSQDARRHRNRGNLTRRVDYLASCFSNKSNSRPVSRIAKSIS